MASIRERAKPKSRPRSLMTRDRSKLLVASAFTLVCLYLCYRLAQPFIPALVFAITIAVVTQPLIRWLESRIKNASIRAAACVANRGAPGLRRRPQE